jgi:dCMP deaminase
MASPRKVVSWDDYFLALANLVATRSKHPRSQHGAVLVDRDKRIVATGYNGCPSGFPDEEVDWNPGMTWTNRDWTIHAEENALLYAGRDAKGCTIYVTGRPCPRCLLRLIHCGVRRIVHGGSSYSQKGADKEVFDRIVSLSHIVVEFYKGGRT